MSRAVWVPDRQDIIWINFNPQVGREMRDMHPMLVLSGEKAGGQFLIDQAKLVDTNVEGVIVKGSGHWLMEEAPEQTIPALVALLAVGGGSRSETWLKMIATNLDAEISLPEDGDFGGGQIGRHVPGAAGGVCHHIRAVCSGNLRVDLRLDSMPCEAFLQYGHEVADLNFWVLFDTHLVGRRL